MSFIGFLLLALQAGFWSGLHSQQLQHFRFSGYPTPRATSLLIKWAFVAFCQFCGPFFVKLALLFLFHSWLRWRKWTRPFFFGGIFTEANAKAINNVKTIRMCCVEARTMNDVTSSQASLLIHDTGMKDLVNDQLR